MGQSKHDQVARRIAAQLGSEYNAGPGADVKASGIRIEVETERSVGEAGRQLQGPGQVYVAGTDERAVQAALERYENSTIGVMDEFGMVRKPSTRR